MSAWLVINRGSTLCSSVEEGLSKLAQTLDHRRNLGCTIAPGAPATPEMQYRVQHPAGGGFELIYLTTEIPDSEDDRPLS